MEKSGGGARIAAASCLMLPHIGCATYLRRERAWLIAAATTATG